VPGGAQLDDLLQGVIHATKAPQGKEKNWVQCPVLSGSGSQKEGPSVRAFFLELLSAQRFLLAFFRVAFFLVFFVAFFFAFFLVTFFFVTFFVVFFL
jgi:hypothetical protein